jgi:hypothetical protein
LSLHSSTWAYNYPPGRARARVRVVDSGVTEAGGRGGRVLGEGLDLGQLYLDRAYNYPPDRARARVQVVDLGDLRRAGDTLQRPVAYDVARAPYQKRALLSPPPGTLCPCR